MTLWLTLNRHHHGIIKSSHQRCSVKKVFLEISWNSQENTCARVSFLIKSCTCKFIKKETLAQVFSCEFCEIFNNTFSTSNKYWKVHSTLCANIHHFVKTFEINGKVCNTKNSYLKGERWFFLKLKKCLNRASMTTLSGIIVF